MEVTFERGVFTLSLDFELIWGTLDKPGLNGFRKACEIEREQVIDRLLSVFVEFEVPATWCVVGHLMLDHCNSEQGVKHPSIVPPRHAWCPDWFAQDPCGNEETFPLFYGRSLIEKIRDCRVPQEIGCHSFSHVIFGDSGCSVETAKTELAACVEAARELKLEMQSFVFPRNSVGHLQELANFGFRVYRGPAPSWDNRVPIEILKRLARLSVAFAAVQPPVVLPEKADHGIWNVPASMMYFPMHGIRRFVPLSLRVQRARKGLNAAVHHKKIFHLWFHPTNLADHMEIMFQGLRMILEHARALRDRNELDILPMNSVIPQE
ncbi:polysaccharide deacetylase [bacterium]|nr:polysaccharide deacetylase [bacterium]MCI0605623.1 polysaccharide deacetylase [bacterium]